MSLPQTIPQARFRAEDGHPHPVRSSNPARSRRRLISFRLTEDEYEGLRRLSDEHGARSLSDFVRSNVCVMLSAPKPWEEDMEHTVREFGRQASELNGLVDQLGHLLRTALRRAM
jgi:hypothetical protein